MLMINMRIHAYAPWLLLAAGIVPASWGTYYQHTYAFLSTPKYPADFTHTSYVNPDAPKGGMIRIDEMGAWDNFNPLALGGRTVRGVEFWVRHINYLYDSLMEPGLDEPATLYGLLAEGIAIDPEGRWVAFRLREGARWHDGVPITTDDLVFSFHAFKEQATPTISTPLEPVTRIEVINAREVRYHIAESSQGDPILPRRVAILPVLPRHALEGQDLSKTSIKPPLGTGPYRVGKFVIGRSIRWERVPDYWGRDVPINTGRYNFDTIKVDYFRNDLLQTEALKGHVTDVHLENVPPRWATAYNIPSVEAGILRKDEFNLLRPSGMWWSLFWNMDKPLFRDIRVREALWLMSDFAWGNRRSYGFWGEALSFFQGSELAATGLPSAAELVLLEPLRGKIPERVFTTPYTGTPHQGTGNSRQNLVRANQLLNAAGWVVRDGLRVNQETGEPMHLRMLAVSADLAGSWRPLANKLKRLGITTLIKGPEISNWLYRMRAGDFDVGALWFLMDFTPTQLVTSTFHSSAADQAYSGNWSNLRDPAIDTLIGHIHNARTWDEYVTALRAFDRVMLWNFYWVPAASKVKTAIAWWDKFGMPPYSPLRRETHFVDLWWWDQDKAARVDEYLGNDQEAP